MTCDRTATHCRHAAIETEPLWSLLPRSTSHLLRLRRRVLQSSIADDLVIWRAIWLAVVEKASEVAVRKSFKPHTQTAL